MDFWVFTTLLMVYWIRNCGGFRFPTQNGTQNGDVSCKNQVTPYLEYQMICDFKGQQKFAVTVVPGKTYDIVCNNINNFDYSNLPRPSLDPDEVNIDYFGIDRCPLTRTSFTDIILHQRVITTRVFSIHNGNFSNVKRRHFLGSNIFNITKLIMNNCSINRMPPTLLRDLKSLEILHLTRNSIRPPKNVFDALTNLEILDLDENDMTELPDGIFSKLSSLQILHLERNKLNVRKSTFEGLASLWKLDLSRNSMTTIPEDTFDHLKKLERIYLNNNKLRTLPRNLLKHNRDLQEFSLSENKPYLSAMPERLLSNLWRLTEVELRLNGLAILPENLFENSSWIINMTLAGNNIESLPECIFGYQSNLKSLSLSYNRLKRLPARIFENLTSLLDLAMEQNYIENLPGNIFKKLENLMSLHIQKNHLKYIEPLQGLQNLLSIDMSKNRLSWEEHGSDCLSPFQNLRNLAILNLRSNRIKHICSDWRGSELTLLPNLDNLDLSFNHISEISSFRDIDFRKTKDFSLNLRGNRIQRILLNETTYTTPNNSVTIYVDYNPFNCDCQLLSFIKYSRQDKSFTDDTPAINFKINSGSCAFPKELYNRTLDSLQLEELSCHYKSDGHCKYVKKPHTLARTIICTDGVINATNLIPELGKLELFEHNHTEMHLSNNQLGELRRFGRISENVTKLYLNGNNLTELTVGDIPSSIEILDLRNNSFVHVNASAASMIVNGTNLKELWISGNPFECDCDNHLLFSLLESHHEKVKDYHLLKCPNGTYIYQLKLGLLCIDEAKNRTPLIVSLVLIGLLLFVMWSFTIWYYNNKDTIKIWLHDNVKWSRRFILKANPPDIDAMRYDVFVSGSHYDNEIIVNEVIFNLEKDGYKVCWHERDWRAGSFIIDSIEKSIQESQTTLFFVTENFVRSTWSCQEFRLAICTAVERGCFNLIVILHGDIGPITELEPTLSNYLKRNTYLKWEDKSFWGRLRVSLPQRICDVRQHSNQDGNNGQMVSLLTAVEPVEVGCEIELEEVNTSETDTITMNTVIELQDSDDASTDDDDTMETVRHNSNYVSSKSINNRAPNGNAVKPQHVLLKADDSEDYEGDNGDVMATLLEC